MSFASGRLLKLLNHVVPFPFVELNGIWLLYPLNDIYTHWHWSPATEIYIQGKFPAFLAFLAHQSQSLKRELTLNRAKQAGNMMADMWSIFSGDQSRISRRRQTMFQYKPLRSSGSINLCSYRHKPAGDDSKVLMWLWLGCNGQWAVFVTFAAFLPTEWVRKADRERRLLSSTCHKHALQNELAFKKFATQL